MGQVPPIPPSPAVAFRRGIDSSEEGLGGRPTAVSLNALAGNDGDIGVICEQGERCAEVLRREAAAEIVDRSKNALDIGWAAHRSTIRRKMEIQKHIRHWPGVP